MKYNFDEQRNRRNTAKWGYASQISGDGLRGIGMGVADMDFRLMPEVADAIRECTELGEFGYAGMAGSDYKAVTDWLAYRGTVVPKE